MSIALNQILSLVGNLDDSIGDNTPRERFRSFLRENITDVIYWIIHVKSDGKETTEEVIGRLVAKVKI